jgi:hypothetical protein
LITVPFIPSPSLPGLSDSPRSQLRRPVEPIALAAA